MVRPPAPLAMAVTLLVVFAAAVFADSSQDAIAKFSAAWKGVKTYTCTVEVHELKGKDVQDRLYHLRFSRPHDTRMDIIGGDGRGSAAVWRGGDQVRGHQGGMLRSIRVNVDIHSRLATTLRGTTIAQANYGALLSHLQSTSARSFVAKRVGDNLEVTASVSDPSRNEDVTREVFVLGRDGLPRQYLQYSKDTLVKRVIYSDVKVNVALPPDTWQV